MGKPSDALKTLSKLPEATTKSPSFLIEYYSAMAYGELKDYPQALRHYTSAELIGKTSDTNRLNHIFYFQFAAALERNKQLEESEKYFRKCLELSPDFAEALNYLGYMWVEQGVKLEEARKFIEKAVKMEPDNGAYLDSLGWLYFKLNQPEKGLKPILRSIEKTKEPDATLYEHLGDIYRALKQPAKAREAWKKSIEVEPSEAIEIKLRETPAP
jgi:tetratricopeptide (TPR) repeat protein